MIAVIQTALVVTAIACLVMLTLLPPQRGAVGPAQAIPSDGAAYFKELAKIGKPISLNQETQMIKQHQATTTSSTTTTFRVVAAPTTTSPPAVAQATGGNCDLVNQFTDWPTDIAGAVCMAESKGNPNALNMNDNHGKCRGSYGLMQNACFWFPFFGYPLTFDPQINIEVAHKIWQRQGGFGAWTTYAHGTYKEYL